MKILHVVKRLKGGVGTYVLEVKKELERLGHEVEIISREDDLKINSFFGSFDKLKRAVIERNADLVNAHDWSVALPLRGLKNLVTTFHGSEVFPKIFLQQVLHSKQLIVVSNNLGELFPKASVIEEGVNLKTYHPLKIKKNGFVGFSQKPSEFYNFSKVLSASRGLGKKLLVGWKNIKNEGVISFDHIKRKDMNKFYNNCSVFVSIPKRTGFNLSLLEAMACEVPVITNYEGAGGKLPVIHIKSLKEDDIKQAIEEGFDLIGKTNYRTWIKKNGYTWDVVAKKLDAFYTHQKRL